MPDAPDASEPPSPDATSVDGAPPDVDSSTAIVPQTDADGTSADLDANAIPDAPLPPPAPTSVLVLRRPPRIFRRLREWVQTRLLALITALGEFIALFAFVLSVILGSIFVLTNRIVLQQVMTPGKMGGSYAPDNRARYTAGALGQAFAIAFVDGLASKPIPIAASGAALPAVRPKLADEARAENSARDALLQSGGGFQASADTKAALSAPILSGRLLASLGTKGGAAGLVIPTRGTGPQPTRAVPTPSPTVPPTATIPGVPSPTVAPTRAATSPTVAPTQAAAAAAASPTTLRSPTAVPLLPTVTEAPPSATVRPSVTTIPSTPTVAQRSPTVAATASSPSPTTLGGTPTSAALPTVTPVPASPTVPVPPSPTTAFTSTPNVSATPRPPPSPTLTHTPTQTPTSTPTPTPTRVGGPSPTALAVLDLSKLVAVPGQSVVTAFPGIFTSSGTDPATGLIGTAGPLSIGAGRQYTRTLLFVNGGDKPIDFVTQTTVDLAYKDSPLWTDIENGLQMEITIDGVSRYLGPLDTTRASTPPYLERIGGNDLMSIGFRIFLPFTAGNEMSRQTVVFNLEFSVTRY